MCGRACAWMRFGAPIRGATDPEPPRTEAPSREAASSGGAGMERGRDLVNSSGTARARRTEAMISIRPGYTLLIEIY